MIPGMPVAAGGAAEPAILTWINSNSSLSDATTYNFGDFNAPADGLMVACTIGKGGSSRTVSSVSIGGTNGTIHISNAGSVRKYAIASRPVLAGNNNVSVTLSGANGSFPVMAVGVWLLEGTDTIHDTDADTSTSNRTSAAVDLTMPANSWAVFGSWHLNGNQIDWSSADERADLDLSDANSRIAFADKFTASLIDPHTETSSWSGSVEARMVGMALS